MPANKTNKAVSYRGLYAPLIILCILLSCIGCRQEATTAEDVVFKAIADTAGKLMLEKSREAAIIYLDSTYKNIENIPPYGKYILYVLHGRYHMERREFQNALLYNDSELLLFNNKSFLEDHHRDYIATLMGRGKVLYELDNYALAAEYFLKVKPYSEGNAEIAWQLNYSLGMTLYSQKKYHDAAIYFKTQLSLLTDSSLPGIHTKQQALNNIALCYDKMKMYDSALYYYDSALSFINYKKELIADTVRVNVYKAVIYGNMGSVYAAKNMPDTAEKLFSKSIEINSRQGHFLYDNRDALLTRIKLARLYLSVNRSDDLKTLLDEIKVILHGMPVNEVERDWNNLMYGYYESQGNVAAAYGYFKRFVHLRDSLNIANRHRTENDMRKELTVKEQQYEIGLLKKDKSIRTLWLAISLAVGIMAIALVALIYTNYRRSKRQNELINAQKGALEKSNKEKERILQVVAHDLRNPVGSIAYLADMQLMDGGSSMPVADSLAMIKDASGNALGLINELLGFDNKIDDASKERTDINRLIAETVRMLEYKAAEKQQQIVVELADTDVTAFINREKIMRVFDNLISNAVKFSSIGGNIVVRVVRLHPMVQVSVQDNGIGIPAHLQPGIFDMFTTSARSGTAGERSYGLGLSICKQITEAHGGRIWLQSEEGNGTVFYVTFPLADNI